MSVDDRSFSFGGIVTPLAAVAVLKIVKGVIVRRRNTSAGRSVHCSGRRLMAVADDDDVMRSHESNSVFGYAQSIQIASDFNR